MTNLCKKIQESILSSDRNLSQNMLDHISECPECEAFASAWMSLKKINLPGDSLPGVDIDRTILDYSCSLTKTVAYNPKLRFSSRIIYFTAAAACLLLISWLAIAMISGNEDQKDLSSAWNTPKIDREMVNLEIGLESIDWDVYGGQYPTDNNNNSESHEEVL